MTGRAIGLKSLHRIGRIKGYPLEAALAGDPASVALSDHVKNLDWRARGATLKGRVTATELAEIKGKLAALIG